MEDTGIKSTRNYGVTLEEISGYQGDALDLGTSRKEFEMSVKSHSCMSFEPWSQPLPGAGLLECQGPLVDETHLRVASATNTDERGLIPGTGIFLNLYSENTIRGPEIQTVSLETRLTKRRHQHSQGVTYIVTFMLSSGQFSSV